jgi:[ribosomal protein S18]-alanine N-acetyltransferase
MTGGADDAVRTAAPDGTAAGQPATQAAASAGEPRLRMMTAGDLDAVQEFEYALFGEEAWSREMLAGEEQADVLTIAVSASRWGHGIGSGLLAALISEARRRGCREMFLEVRSDNARAQRLYQWWGFAEIGIRRGYYQPSGTDAVVMRRDLVTASEAELASRARPGPVPESGDA